MTEMPHGYFNRSTINEHPRMLRIYGIISRHEKPALYISLAQPDRLTLFWIHGAFNESSTRATFEYWPERGLILSKLHARYTRCAINDDCLSLRGFHADDAPNKGERERVRFTKLSIHIYAYIYLRTPILWMCIRYDCFQYFSVYTPANILMEPKL